MLRVRFIQSLRLAVPLLLTGLAGCFGGGGRELPDQDLELYKLQGSVKVDGEVAAGVSIGFQPADGTPGSGGFATTDAEGKFTAVSASGREGLPPGKYHVLLSWLTTADGKPIPKDALAADMDFKNNLPERFKTPDGSPYFTEVTAGENSDLELNVNTRAR